MLAKMWKKLSCGSWVGEQPSATCKNDKQITEDQHQNVGRLKPGDAPKQIFSKRRTLLVFKGGLGERQCKDETADHEKELDANGELIDRCDQSRGNWVRGGDVGSEFEAGNDPVAMMVDEHRHDRKEAQPVDLWNKASRGGNAR